MEYWKIVEDGVIKEIGRSKPPQGTIISAAEYNEILSVIRAQTFEPGFSYELLEDLTWRITPIEPEPEPEEDSDDN